MSKSGRFCLTLIFDPLFTAPFLISKKESQKIYGNWDF